MMAAPLPREKFYKMMVNNREEQACSCWWPVWANDRAFENTEKVTVSNRNVGIATWESANRSFTVSQGEPMEARVATFYYPYWKASVNGQPAEVKMDENGVILIPIPAEASKVRLYFEEPYYYAIAFWISALTWIFLLLAIIATCWKSRTPSLRVFSI
jgi:uncharacterized membrane protein YfhO